MNILVAAGLSDFKIKTTLAPLIFCKDVEKIYLVRKRPFYGEKIICYSPPKWMRSIIIFSEAYRLIAIFYICIFRNIRYLVAIHFYLHSLFIALAGIVFRLPYVISIIEEPKLYEKHSIFYLIIKKAHSIAVRGTISKRYIEKLGIDSSKIFILPDFLPDCNECVKQCENKKYDFLFLGGFVREKRVDILIDVFAGLKERGISFRAAIAGDGILRHKIRKQFNAKKLHSYVEMLGYVNNPFTVIECSKILIMTSFTEGMPTVLVEAMSRGLPFIVPDVGDITDYAIHGYNALVYEPLNINQCIDFCEKILSDSALYNKFCKNTKRLWNEKYKDIRIENVSRIWTEMFNVS